MSLNKLFVRATAFSFLLLVAILSVFSFSVQQTSAQEQSFPDVSVTKVTTDKATYASGDTVTGTITVKNADAKDLTDIYYDMSLVGDYSTAQGRYDLPAVSYDTKSTPPLFLSANLETVVPFTYIIPAGISGDGLGIQIQLRVKTGFPLGWGDAKIKVTGGVPLLTLTEGWLVVDGVDYGVQSGPTMYATSTGTIHITLSNPTSEDITVTPSVKVYDRVIAGEPLKTYVANSVTVKAKKTQKITIPVDTLNNTPKVYDAEVSFFDSSNLLRAPKIAFRYIVSGGAIATIQSVTTDLKGLTVKGDVVNVSVSYSGSPYDINLAEALVIGEAVLNVKLIDDATNNIIGETSIKSVNFDIDYGTTIVPITPTDGSRLARVEISIIKDGVTIGSYKTIITPPEKNWPVPLQKSSKYYIKSVAIGFLIIILVIIVLIWKKKRTTVETLSILFLLISFGLLLGVPTKVAWADITIYPKDSTTTIPDWSLWKWRPPEGTRPRPYNGKGLLPPAPTVTLRTYNNYVVQGDTLYFAGKVLDNRCENTDLTLKLFFSIDDASYTGPTSKISYDTTGYHNSTVYDSSDFSFTANTTNLAPGVHNVNFSTNLNRQGINNGVAIWQVIQRFNYSEPFTVLCRAGYVVSSDGKSCVLPPIVTQIPTLDFIPSTSTPEVGKDFSLIWNLQFYGGNNLDRHACYLDEGSSYFPPLANGGGYTVPYYTNGISTFSESTPGQKVYKLYCNGGDAWRFTSSDSDNNVRNSVTVNVACPDGFKEVDGQCVADVACIYTTEIGECDADGNKTQTYKLSASSPAGCVGDPPEDIISPCNPCIYTTEIGECDADNYKTQTYKLSASSPIGCIEDKPIDEKIFCGSVDAECFPQVKDATSPNFHDANFANVNQLVTWQAPNFSGTWSENSSGAPVLHTGSTYPIKYPTIGNKTMWLKVGSNNPVQCTTNINGTLKTYLPIINNPNFVPF